jgi:hypothetical protein
LDDEIFFQKTKKKGGTKRYDESGLGYLSRFIFSAFSVSILFASFPWRPFAVPFGIRHKTKGSLGI